MIISEIAIRRPVFTSMFIAALVVFGWVSFREIGVDLFPRVEFPIITIVTRLQGADPETIETTVTDPIEEAVNTTAGIKTLNSTSADGVSQVIVEFELEKNVDIAFQEIQAKVSAVRSSLPNDIDAPVVEKVDIDAAPTLSVIIAGDMPFRDLSHLADQIVKERLQRVANVGSVKLVGNRDRKIWLWLNPDKMRQYGLTVFDVKQALAREHVEIPGGRVETGPLELTIKTKAEFETEKDFNSMVIACRNNAVVRLSDIGRAEDGLEEKRTHAQLDGQSSIALLVRRQSGANTVRVANDVKAEVEKLRKELEPRGVRLIIAQDQAAYIEQSVREVEHDLIIGGFLAVVIVALFLLNFRSSFISALVLPTSVIATFMMLRYMGFTINMMTLLGLNLAIGLLIDDAIVVQENIMRHVQAGKPARQAALFATSEIGLAVFATTMCVVAVFVPVAYTRGIVGRFFFPFALTVAFAVLISMVISFTLDPMLSARLLVKRDKHNFIFTTLEKLHKAIEQFYAWLLDWCLRHRALVILAALMIFVGSLSLTKFLSMEFHPVEDQSEFNISVRAPLGSSLERTVEVINKIHARIKKYPEVQYTFATVGADAMQRVNEAVIYTRLTEKHERRRSQQDIMNEARRDLKDIQDATVSVQVVSRVAISGMRSQQLQLEVRGPDFAVSNAFIAKLSKRLEAAGGYVDIDTTFETGKPEADILVDRARAADLGVSPRVIGDTARAAIGGLDIGKFKADGDRYNIAVRYQERYRNKTDLIGNLWVPTQNGGMIELSNVARVVTTGTPVEINRFNRQRQITLLANLGKKPDGSGERILGDAVNDINKYVAEIGVPDGYQTSWTGFADIMKESFGYLFFTMYLSIIVVYMVLAAQFESFIHPFTIMLSLPLAIIGALSALLICNMTVSIFTMIAFIFLLGLVTKNAILLLDYTNTLRTRDELSLFAALRQAGRVRLRPILMTTFAMIFGMLPIALGVGAGAESRQPMAVAIIGGLISSTALTLLIVPVVYSLLDQLGDRLKKLILPPAVPKND
ncbi:MAG: efflux RND transporter permease subunit [Planctomycetota bacterium]